MTDRPEGTLGGTAGRDSREKLEARFYTALNAREEEIAELEHIVGELTAERDELASDLCECDENRIEFKGQRDRLEREVRQLSGDLDGARAWRDYWRGRAVRAERTVGKFKRMLEAERKLARMWPRFTDGRPVRVGDEIGFEGGTRRVNSIRFHSATFKIQTEHKSFTEPFGTEIAYPPLKAKDGQPIEVGQTLYGEDGHEWDVKSIDWTEPKYPICAMGLADDDVFSKKRLKPEWLTHEAPWSLEKAIGNAFMFAPSSAMPGEIRDKTAKLASEIREKLAKGE